VESLSKKLKDRLKRRDIFLLPGAPNALTARIIEDIGFEAIYVTGAGITNTYLGIPDLGFITLTELADHVAAIRDVVNLPLIADADTGFGNALNVRRTVKVLERSGANGIQIEDQAFPKRCGHFSDKEVIGGEEMVQKIHAAVDARQDENFVIIARTDARAVLGFEEAIERASLYFASGADVTFVEAPQSVEEIAAIPRRLPGPQIINMVMGGRTPLVSLEELRVMNYGAALYANAALQSAIHGMQNVLRHLHDCGSITEVLEQMAPFDERQRLVAKPAFDELEKRYGVKRRVK
jgi:2-methylisocitrate lyase-like PEP mutase family enzyme